MTRALDDFASPDFAAGDDLAAAAVVAAAGVEPVAAGVPVVAAVGVDEGAEDITSATVAGTFSFLTQPEPRSAAEMAKERSRIFMAQITL